MITLDELLCGHEFFEQTPEVQANLLNTVLAMNVVRAAYGKPMVRTSGLRTIADHLRVYRELAAKRGAKFDESKVPMGSKHLTGQAIDISDPDGSLMDWCLANVTVLEDAKVWLEERDEQPRVHFQTVPPKSGKRFFKP
jgi:uncharacterized protein YcbK (DUF882 family)